MDEYNSWFWLLGLFLLIPSSTGAQWTATTGPHGPVIRAFASDGVALYIADDLGVHESRDRGETWTAIGPAFDQYYYAPGNHDAWGLVVRQDTLIVAGKKGVRVRAGAGAPWTPSNSGLPDEDIVLTALADGPQGLVALSLSGGVYRSTDGGAHWEGALSMQTFGNAASMAMDGGILYATLNPEHGLYRSRDNGRSWNACALPRPGGDSMAVTVACLHPYVFASFNGEGVFRSVDSGSHWEKIASGIASDSGRPDAPWKVYVAGSRVYLTHGGKLFISADTGKSWSGGADFPYSGYDGVQETGLYAVGADLFAISQLGVFRSRDQGATWREANNGIACCLAGEMAAIGPGRMLATTQDGVFGTSDLGMHWEHLSNPTLTGTPASLLVFGGQIFAPVPAIGLFRSRDGAQSWEKTISASTEGAQPSLFPMGTDLYYSAGPNRFLRSVDSGAHWSPVPGWENRTTLRMAYCDGIPYALVRTVDGGDSLFHLEKEGAKEAGAWVSNRADFSNLNVKSMGAMGRVLLIGTESRGLYGSTDSGMSFMPVADASLYWGKISCLLTLGEAVYAGTDSGVAIGKTGSAEWRLVNAGLPPPPTRIDKTRIYSLHAQDGFLFAATETGIWKLTIGNDAIRAGGRPFRRKRPARWVPVSGGIGFRGVPESPLRRADGRLSPAAR